MIKTQMLTYIFAKVYSVCKCRKMLSNNFISFIYQSLNILREDPRNHDSKNMKEDFNLPLHGANQINCKTVVFPKSHRNIKTRVASLFM